LKKDAAWKPLIRLFRRFLKKNALPKEIYDQVQKVPLAEQGALYSKALYLPEELAKQPKMQLAMLMLMKSHQIVCRK
jgi:hypothetical protein